MQGIAYAAAEEGPEDAAAEEERARYGCQQLGIHTSTSPTIDDERQQPVPYCILN